MTAASHGRSRVTLEYNCPVFAVPMQPNFALALGLLHKNCRVSVEYFNYWPVRPTPTLNYEIIDICFKIFGMALYKVVSQLLELVR